MKQYLLQEQTAKLIELGFDRPNGIVSVSLTQGDMVDICGRYDMELEYEYAYSIGELIEMLPDEIYVDETVYSKVIDKISVCYYSWALETYAISICDVQEELIDNLYDMVIKLKEEEVI